MSQILEISYKEKRWILASSIRGWPCPFGAVGRQHFAYKREGERSDPLCGQDANEREGTDGESRYTWPLNVSRCS